ncbi:hypothetical protein DFS34DRAFT_601739 [Phlyctochytrium arcticum]|nr:hypothetical protein DFS34DRAFT_601739 [Phlyctochytrium arcticum]
MLYLLLLTGYLLQTNSFLSLIGYPWALLDFCSNGTCKRDSEGSTVVDIHATGGTRATTRGIGLPYGYIALASGRSPLRSPVTGRGHDSH